MIGIQQTNVDDKSSDGVINRPRYQGEMKEEDSLTACRSDLANNVTFEKATERIIGDQI